MARSTGSKAAKGGFCNEALILRGLNAGNAFAKKCLAEMGIPDSAVIEAVKVPANLGKESLKELLNLAALPSAADVKSITMHQKADIKLGVTLQDKSEKMKMLSLKKANKNSDYNQVDRRKVELYQAFWGFDDDICLSLKLFTGATSPAEFQKRTKGLQVDAIRNRIAFKNLPDDKKKSVLDFFEANKRRVISDVVAGSGQLAADYMLVTQQATSSMRVHLCAIGDVIDYLADDPVQEGSRTTIRVGKLTVQRKGGTPDPTSLQFKIKPSILFNVDGLTLRVKVT